MSNEELQNEQMENETISRKLSDKQNCPCYGQNIDPIESKVFKSIPFYKQSSAKGCYLYLNDYTFEAKTPTVKRSGDMYCENKNDILCGSNYNAICFPKQFGCPIVKLYFNQYKDLSDYPFDINEELEKIDIFNDNSHHFYIQRMSRYDEDPLTPDSFVITGGNGPCDNGQQNFFPNRQKYKLEIKQRETCDNIDASYFQASLQTFEDIYFESNDYNYYKRLKDLPEWVEFDNRYKYRMYQKGIRGDSIIFLSIWPNYNAYYNQIHDLNDYKRIVENKYDCPGKIELQYMFESLEGGIKQNMEISRKVYTLMTALPIQFFVFFILLCFGISLLYKFILNLYKEMNFKQVWGKIIYYITCKKNDNYLKKLEQEKILKQIQEENKKKNEQLQKKQQQEQKQNLEKVKIPINNYQEQPKFQKENKYQSNNKEQDNYNMEDKKIQEFQFQTEEALMSQKGNLHEYYKQEDIIHINNQNDNNFYNQQKYFWPQQQDYPLYPLQSQYYVKKDNINQYNNQDLYKKHDKNINNVREKDGKQQFKNQQGQKFSLKQIKLQQSKLDSNQGDMININPLIELPQDQISGENSERKFNTTQNSNNKNKVDLQKPYNPFASKQLIEQNGGEIDEKNVNPYLIQNDKSLILNYNKQKQAKQRDVEIKRLESINIDYKEENQTYIKK